MYTPLLKDWLYSRTTKFIQTKTLGNDINRGVKFLSESSYSNALGCTKSSILFIMKLRNRINLSKVYRVDLKYTPTKHWYTVELFTKDGFHIQLKGCSYGYYGEGSRGTYAVLKECGFDEKRIQRIFEIGADKKSIRMYRRVA
jgi:hypothetical protein